MTFFESSSRSIFLFEHDLRANASRLSRGKTGTHPRVVTRGHAFPHHALSAERIYSSLAKTLLAARGEDLATGLPRLDDRWKSRALTGGAIDFCPCFLGVGSLHELISLQRGKPFSYRYAKSIGCHDCPI